MHVIRRFLSFLLVCCALALPAPGRAQVATSISVNVAPPPLPVYSEPPLPADGYIFTPGYWAWGPSGFYWVPGTWVLPPSLGLLWTPGFWALVDGAYLWHPGYWGPHVGFYGGINYGFGYFGKGYEGGYWEHDHFFYNSAIHNFGSVHVANVYRRTVPNDRGAGLSFVGGPHGTAARPAPEEDAASREPHAPPSDLQSRHESAARGLHPALASVNRGQPPVAATPKPATFTGRGIVSARRAGPGAAHPAAARPAPAAKSGPPPGHAPDDHGKPEH